MHWVYSEMNVQKTNKCARTCYKFPMETNQNTKPTKWSIHVISFHFIKEHPFNVSRTEKFFGILIRWLLRNNIIFKYEYCILWFRYTYVFAWDFYFFLLSPLIYNLCGILHVCEMLFFGEMCALVCIYAICVWCNKKWENTNKIYTNSIR